jgi:hypothetical protein
MYRSTFSWLRHWRWVVSFTPLPLYPRYPFSRRLGGPQSQSGRCGGETILDPTRMVNRDYVANHITGWKGLVFVQLYHISLNSRTHGEKYLPSMLQKRPLTLELDGGEWSASCPSCFTPGGKKPSTQWIWRGLVGPQSQSGCCAEEKNLLP